MGTGIVKHSKAELSPFAKSSKIWVLEKEFTNSSVNLGFTQGRTYIIVFSPQINPCGILLLVSGKQILSSNSALRI